jgi:Peptidase C1-like family
MPTNAVGGLIFSYQTLKAGQPVFFGCDVGQFSQGSSGIMDTELFEYEVSPIGSDHALYSIVTTACRTPLTFRFHFPKLIACAPTNPL